MLLISCTKYYSNLSKLDIEVLSYYSVNQIF